MHTSQNLYKSISKALLATTNAKNLHKLHSLIITIGLHKSLFFSGTLVSKYSQLRDPNSSSLVFRTNPLSKNAYLWNTIIRAMTHNGLFAKAIEFYEQMRKSQVKPDNYTFPSVINACGSLLDFEKGRFVHQHVMELGFGSDLYVNNALIDMYSRFNELGCAREVFDKMPGKDIVSYNSLISGYSSNGCFDEALEIYYRLRLEGLAPDSFSFSRVLAACGGLGEVKEGQIVHGLVQKVGICRDVIVKNGLLSMYFKLEMVDNCSKIFSEMIDRDSVSWNIMIVGYSDLGFYEEAMRLFMEMVDHFEPDILTITSVLRACSHMGDLKVGKYVHDYMVKNGHECDTLSSNIVINMYAKCGDMLRSRQVFEKMGSKDLVSWNSLINGYIENQLYQEAIELFRKMKRKLQPDFVTYLALLSVSKELMNIDFSEELHCDIIKTGFDSTRILGNALVDAYAKCGKLEYSLKQFDNMKTRDIFTWNSIISACSHSENSIGFRMLNRMKLEQLMPDVTTLLSALPLCSYLTAKRQGKELHGCIFKLGFESNIPIANALIEMYSNIGHLRNSVQVFELMKERDIVSWTTLITSYGMYGEGTKALIAFENMKADGILPDHIVFIAIIYACSHSGLVKEGRTLFEQMKNDYKLEPSFEHYACVVDLLSRSGLLYEAEEFILSMPSNPDASIWGALLSASRANGDSEIAERVSHRIFELNTNDQGYRVLASNVCASLGKWDQARMIRKSLGAGGLKKGPGSSWVEV